VQKIVQKRMRAPDLPHAEIMRLPRLYRASPLGMVGAGATGVMLGAFYGLGAVFARGVSLTDSGTALFMSATILGGVALQYPLGRLSDFVDRRKVIVAGFLATFAVCLGIIFTAEGSHQLMLGGGLFVGACFALYPLCVAHTNDHLRTSQRVSATGGLVLVYSLGAAAGPLLAATLMDAMGPRGLFAFIALCAAALLVFALLRLCSAPPVPGNRQRPYLVLPRTTPLAAKLDPLAPET
jgi:MFS family permease